MDKMPNFFCPVWPSMAVKCFNGIQRELHKTLLTQSGTRRSSSSGEIYESFLTRKQSESPAHSVINPGGNDLREVREERDSDGELQAVHIGEPAPP